MTSSDHQAAFLLDVADLVLFAKSALGLKLTGGELYRPPALQRYYVEAGLSWTLSSRHLSRMAIDVNVFGGGLWRTDDAGNLVYEGGRYLMDDEAACLEAVRPLGDYFEQLSPYNRWAVRNSRGVLVDLGHFERRITTDHKTRAQEDAERRMA